MHVQKGFSDNDLRRIELATLYEGNTSSGTSEATTPGPSSSTTPDDDNGGGGSSTLGLLSISSLLAVVLSIRLTL